MATAPRRSSRSTRRARGQVLPVLPLKDTVVFPDSMSPLVVQRDASVRLLEYAGRDDDRVVLATVERGEVEDLDDVTPEDLFRVGTEVTVHRRIALPDGTVRALVQGVRRVRLVGDAKQFEPFFTFEVEPLEDEGDDDADEVRALHAQLVQTFVEAIEHAPYLPDELAIVATNVEEPGELCHLVASTVKFDVADRQRVLECVDVHERQRLVLRLLGRELELLELGAKIQGEVHVELSRSQREFFLRKQLDQIREELGEGEDDLLRELREALDDAELPDVARRAADRELLRLQRTPEQSSEHGVIRTWLEWLSQLPWQRATSDDLKLEHARQVLDADHFGLEDVKDRILDHLAVSQLTGGDLGGAILCFVGPPGVGKTSLGRSIAAALGREFAQVSVGGVRDESEVRGHRRTYVGAMPGTIMRALRDAGSNNPVFMVDEIDKMGADSYRGDPASAMLELLDPEQNHAFRDHYLDVPFDLSRTLFICTANRLDTIPPALLDRMEVITLEGYSEQEKLGIARHHLVPAQLKRHGLPKSKVTVPVATLRTLISGWTREAGVRELDRRLATLARKAARRIAEASERGEAAERWTVAPDELDEVLGHRRFQHEERRRTRRPGVTQGLAVTGAGGELLFIEAAATPGAGKLVVTGQVGDVMQESARAALTWLRAHAATQADDPEAAIAWFQERDLHVHVPAGAIPKDGPSAGIAIATALASLWKGTPVRDDLAMTGELTLHGEVLPIGGVRQKVLAAQRAGIRHVALPDRNEGDWKDVPEPLRKGMQIHFVEHASDVLEIALRR